MVSRPALVAEALLQELGIVGIPNVREISQLLGVEIEEAAIESFDGALIRIKGSTQGMIAVRQTIRELGKKTFTIAHELGHLLLPGHDEATVCLQSEVENWEAGVPKQELEANEFAGELLMPSHLIRKALAGQKPSFDLIEELAKQYSVSLTASAYRFVELSSHPCAIVWSQEGSSRWFKRSREFEHWVRLGQELDSRTFAADCMVGEDVPTKAESVPAAAWITGDVADHYTLLEETRCMPFYSGSLSLLWLHEPLARSADDDQLLRELSPEDFMLGRKKWPGRR